MEEFAVLFDRFTTALRNIPELSAKDIAYLYTETEEKLALVLHAAQGLAKLNAPKHGDASPPLRRPAPPPAPSKTVTHAPRPVSALPVLEHIRKVCPRMDKFCFSPFWNVALCVSPPPAAGGSHCLQTSTAQQ